MQTLAQWIGFSTLAFEAILLGRAVRGRFLNQFPYFYSYLFYVFCSSVLLFPIYLLRLQLYASAYWFYFLITILVEFAIVVEISDHTFRPYPAIRSLGRGIILLVLAAFGIAFIIPALFRSHAPGMGFLDFSLRSSLTKAFMILALLAVVRHYRVALSRNVRGLVLGFSIYLLMNVANFAEGRIPARWASSRIETTSHALSYVVQPVTQWKSVDVVTFGRARNSSYERRRGASTSPSTRKSHVFGSNRGTTPRSSRGHFRTLRWPGGRRRGSAIERIQ